MTLKKSPSHEHVADEQVALNHVLTKATRDVRKQFTDAMSAVRAKAAKQAGRRVLAHFSLYRDVSDTNSYALEVNFDIHPPVIQQINFKVDAQGVTTGISCGGIQ
jgi:hypothetical protein